MAGVYVNFSGFESPYKMGMIYGQSLKNFHTSSSEAFVFWGAFDGPEKIIPIPCYKTNKVTIDGERVYYPAMSLADAKAFKEIGNKPFLTREDKSVMAKVSQALDKCAESYGLEPGSISLKALSAYYEHYDKTQRCGLEQIDYLKKISAASNT